jgi:hypothetical protein
MERLFRIGLGLGLGLMCAYLICALFTLEVHPTKWETGIKAFGTFIVIMFTWGFADKE